ncbi:MAG: peptide/nickel transport system substrate-binding protein [Acetobacteraceae bacterium]|nr:peptide/nickel transport system substrate-binding protein [Acetobacteraceae bacterium]
MPITRRMVIGSSIVLSSYRPARAAAAVLRIGISTSLNTLDPMLTTLGDEYIYDNIVFNGLTRMREDLSIEPDLAESWSSTEDLKRWTFRLRHGVKFHNGQEMVAEDVVASFRRLLDPASGAPARSQYEMVAAVSAPDPATVVFELKVPYSGLADVLSDRQVKITPRDAVGQLATQPIGTGPFKFVSYTPGDRVVMTRNADYFEPGLPKLDGVELHIIPEMSVKIAALQAGDIDVVWDLPLEQVKPLSSQGELRADSVATASWDGAVMNNLVPPFNDVRVRQAFHLAVDKKDVIELTLYGQGVETISPIPPTHPFYARDVAIPAIDPAASRRLLAEAGYPNGLSVPIIVPVGRPVRERLGITLQQLAKPGGFDLQVRRVPYSNFTAEVSGKAQLYTDGFFARPTIDTSTYPFLHSGASWNENLWHYSNPAVDKALETARQSGDPAVQKSSYIAMQTALVANPPSFFAYNANFACAYRKSVGGIKTHPMRWFDLRTATMS